MNQLWIPVHRLLPTLNEYRGTGEHLGPTLERKLSMIRNGEQEFVSEELADTLLSKMDLNEWWRIRPEDGGLADIYVDGKQYGCPARRQFDDADRVKARVARREARCGTESRYSLGCRCNDCKTAHAIYNRERWHARKKAAA